jgi:hypothetical protein
VVGPLFSPHHRSNGAVDERWQKFNDAQSALTAIEWIKNASKYTEPFFLAVGFHRPHIPHLYPKEFEFNGTVVFPPKDYAITKGVPYMAPHDWTTEGSTYSDLRAIDPSITAHHFRKNLSSLCTAVPFAKQAEMKRSYASCIRYIDHLVGQLLQALDEESLYEQTAVIFWGDHGYKFGEHGDWFKHDNLVELRGFDPVSADREARRGCSPQPHPKGSNDRAACRGGRHFPQPHRPRGDHGPPEPAGHELGAVAQEPPDRREGFRPHAVPTLHRI